MRLWQTDDYFKQNRIHMLIAQYMSVVYMMQVNETAIDWNARRLFAFRGNKRRISVSASGSFVYTNSPKNAIAALLQAPKNLSWKQSKRD